MAKRLTDKAIERLRVKRKPYVLWDAAQTGLGVKKTPTGKTLWVMQLRYPGHKVQTTRTLGPYPALKVTDARERAAEWYGLVKRGINPAETEVEKERAAAAARRTDAVKKNNTFASIAERYIAERSSNRRAEADAREIRRMLIPEWGERPIHEIAPRDVRELITKLRTRVPYDARNAWTHLVGILKQSVHDELIDASPCASLDKKLLFKGAKIGPRARFLDDLEIQAFWRSAMRLKYPNGPLYQLLLLTAVRLNEAAKARWSEFHPEMRQVISQAKSAGIKVNWAAVRNDAKSWIVPSERFKSGRKNLVPLSDDVCRILEKLPRFPKCEFLFSSNGKSPIYGISNKTNVSMPKCF
jgi:integrase